MDSYLMMLYVSLDQERAMRNLFSDNGWKYCKPDLLQLTDELGGMIANSMSGKTDGDKIRGFTSPSHSDKINITSPSRPATRSQKANKRLSSVKNATKKRKTRSFGEKTDIREVTDVTVIKEEREDVVDDDDLNDYMEHGDKDDDYVDDDDKDVKRKVRRLTRNFESDHSTVEEDVTAKLDGTEDIEPEDSTMVFDEEENSTDDEVNESNTYNLPNSDPLFDENPEKTVKVVHATRITGKKGKRSKLDKKANPVQYQCGICKVKYLDKKELNKHLTDKVCQGDEEDKVSKENTDESELGAKSEQVFDDNIVLEETEKITQFPDVVSTEDHCDDKVEDKSKSESNEENEDAENKTQKNFYKCDQCDLAYKTTYNLKTHQVMKHRMTFDESFECNVCHLSYGSEHILNLHKLDKHAPSGDVTNRVQCEDCDMWCNDTKSYETHKKREHNIIVCTEVNRNHICSICGKGFTRRDSLKSHCDIIHLRTKQRKQKPKPTERKYVCDFCGKAFLRRNNLSEHIGVKHKDTAKKHKCDDCGETFLRPYALEYHVNKVHLHKKPYECDKCHKMYFSPINLRQHQEHCYKEEEEKELCPYCDKRFVHKRNLSMHIEAIHSQSLLTCECGYVIKWRSSIAKHRRRCPLLKSAEDGEVEQNQNMKRNQIRGPKVIAQNEITETIGTDAMQTDVSNSAVEISNAESSADAGFTTISTDAGMQVISNEIAQALREQGLLIDGTVAGTLKMEDGRTVVEEDPSVQSFENENSRDRQLEPLTARTKAMKTRYKSKFATPGTSTQFINTSTSKSTSVTEDDFDLSVDLKMESVSSGCSVSDSKTSKEKAGDSASVTKVGSDCGSNKEYLTDAWCIEKEKGTVLMTSLRPKKPVRMKVAGEKPGDSGNVYECDNCGKTYSQRSTWKRHLKSHKPGVQHCGQCSMYFDTVDQLESHNEKFHSVCYVCTVCGAGLTRKSVLRKHMLRLHPEHCKAKFSCPHSSCKAIFDIEELYKDHLNIHDGRKPHNCVQCTRSFSTKSSLRLHENNHNVDNSVQCEDCGRKFSGSGALYNHRASVHENKRFKCDQCEKVFIYRSGYCKHLLSHKKEKSESKSVLTCSVVRGLKSNDGKDNKNIEIKKENELTVDQTGSGNDTGIDCQKEQNHTNQVSQREVRENQSVENMNQVETIVSSLPNVGMSQLQPPVLAGQEVTGFPLTTVQLDPSTRVMWICRT